MTTTFPADAENAWTPALTHSAFLRRLLAARPAVAAWLETHWQAPLSAQTMQDFLGAQPISDEESLKNALRQLRQRVMAHLVVRDVGGQAPLAEVVETMTLLADLTTNHALNFLHRQLAGLYGEPLDAQGQPQRLMVIGMGKLGGRELNVSSDVDYIFIYPAEGETSGPKRLDNHEFFNRLGKKLIAAIGECTGEGQVFRVDMRLRPHGDSGPLTGSLDALENYFITQGREWERYAWIKARVMNAGDNLQPAAIDALTAIARPFIFRRYLDFGAINAMRALHAQIRREVARRDMAAHIKLGPGGIREIEFIAQVFQLIRGGRDLALQVRPTQEVLQLAVERTLIPPETEEELASAYIFLRRLEHRLQYVEDAQTHQLPADPVAQAQIADSMGFLDWDTFHEVLARHRRRVSHHFEAIFADPDEGTHPLAGLWLGHCEAEDGIAQLGELGYRQPAEAWSQLERFRASSRYQQLATSNRERLDAVGPRLLQTAARTHAADLTLQRGLAFLEAIARRGAYLALLQQYPHALDKVAELIGASGWAAEFLTRHPILLDEVLDPRLYDIATDWPAFRERVSARLTEQEDDPEQEMDILREAHHAQVFRVLVQDLAGLHTLECISDHLSELADIVVDLTMRQVWPRVRNRHREAPAFAVIGYGKLGGKELGYGSDLDLVFLYDDADPNAGEIYGRFGQRINTWLSSQTAAGILFETDLRLRPNGESGLIAVSCEAFRDYQLHHAWAWEHQALTRARFVAGAPAVGARFEAVRDEILRLPRTSDTLRDEVLAMRQKMRDAHGSKSETEFDLKHDTGGIVDVEFIVQYLILANAHRHPELTGNLGNIALLKIAAGLGLIDNTLATAAADAYREYRRRQHALRLNSTGGKRVERAGCAPQISAVCALWTAVFATA